MSPQLAVVTVTYSPGEHLDRFVTSLASSLAGATDESVQIILADNGSTDGSPERAAQTYDNVRLLETGANIGYGGAVNRAVAELDPSIEFVIVANPDVEWQPGAVAELLAAAQRWPRAGSLGPVVRELDGSVYPSARSVPGLLSGAGHALLGTVWPSNPWTQSYRQENEALSERPVGWLSGSCLLLRRSAFDSVNGFDSRYFMYMEDVDLGDRFRRAGWLNVYVPSAEVLHDKGHSTGRDPARNLRAHHTSTYIYLSDRHHGWWRAPLRWTMKGALELRAHAAVRRSRRERQEGLRDR